MSKTIAIVDALKKGIIHTGDYILTTIPKDRQVDVSKKETGWRDVQTFRSEAGEEKLWRMEDGLILLGELTKKGLTLQEQEGFMQGPDTMHRIMSELYALPEFEQVRSCSLPQKDYAISPDVEEAVQKEMKKYKSQEAKILDYWLASRCTYSKDSLSAFGVFLMYDGKVEISCMYNSIGRRNLATNSLRPKAISKPTLLLQTEGCDGTINNPWRLSK